MSRFLSVAVLAVCFLFLVAGCALQTRDLSSRTFMVPEGSRVEVLRAITVPPGRTRVFLQAGRPGGGTGQYYPSCNFEVRDLKEDEAQTIEPGVFRVTRVHRAPFVEVVQRAPLRLASLGLAMGDGDSDGSDTMVTRTVHMELASEAQPNVSRLTCRGGFADPFDADYPSIEEIRQALGDWARIELPGGA
ncbi:MAG: hypothetical protein PVG98_15720 [Chromatiales bacterium]|jgi:hypothetical protein